MIRVNASHLPIDMIDSTSMPPELQPISPDASTLIGYFDPQQPIGELHGNLPHWRQEGVTYFVTFRLADSIPQPTLDLWIRERDDCLKRHPEPRDAQEKWLDAGHGACVLGQRGARDIVAEALPYFESARYS